MNHPRKWEILASLSTNYSLFKFKNFKNYDSKIYN